MKNKFRVLVSLITVTVCLINMIAGIPLLSSAESYIYEGPLLEPEFIVSGAENLTKNADGTWTATGDFTVKCPMDFDPSLQRYSFEWEVISSDGIYDFDISFYSSDTDTTTIALWEDYYHAYLGITGSYTGSDDLAAIYEMFQKYDGWSTSDNHVKCDTITFRAKTATTTTFTYLGTNVIPRDVITFENNYVNTGNGAADIVGVAQTQIGYTEGSLEGNVYNKADNFQKYGVWYDEAVENIGASYAAWDTTFVAWCAKQAGIGSSVIPYVSYTPYSVSRFKKCGLFQDAISRGGNYTPKAGDLVYFSTANSTIASRMGIVTKVDDTMLYTIEGNTHGHSGLMTDCAVHERQYSLSYANLLGYATPQYKSYAGEDIRTDLRVFIKVTDDNQDKCGVLDWSLADFIGTGVEYVSDVQSVITGIDGEQYHFFKVATDTPEATRLVLTTYYDVAYCEYTEWYYRAPSIVPENKKTMDENGTIYHSERLAVLIKEDKFLSRSTAEFSDLAIERYTEGRFEALGITWILLESADFGNGANSVDAMKIIKTSDYITACEPAVWWHLNYGTPQTGDVNFDGILNTTDARELLLYTMNDVYLKAGDLNEDGAMTTSDARAMLLNVIR